MTQSIEHWGSIQNIPGLSSGLDFFFIHLEIYNSYHTIPLYRHFTRILCFVKYLQKYLMNLLKLLGCKEHVWSQELFKGSTRNWFSYFGFILMVLLKESIKKEEKKNIWKNQAFLIYSTKYLKIKSSKWLLANIVHI